MYNSVVNLKAAKIDEEYVVVSVDWSDPIMGKSLYDRGIFYGAVIVKKSDDTVIVDGLGYPLTDGQQLAMFVMPIDAFRAAMQNVFFSEPEISEAE